MSTTIREVAKKAQVSIATVSRVLNNVGSVDEETRRHVRAVARQMRYVPNAAGRSLSTKRTDAIGLLLPDLYGEFFSEVLRGCDKTAQQARYHFFVSSSHNNREEIRSALVMMRGRVDGLVIMSPHIDAHTLNENISQNLPVVLLNCYIDDTSFDSLNIDNFGGAYQMVDHLLQHKYRRIAIIKGIDQNIDARERLRGYRVAMDRGGGDLDPRLIVSGDFSEATAYDATKKLLAVGPRPEAIFASNDAMAVGALSALRDAGVHVPGEIALAGFDDIPIVSYLTPALTSVHVGIHNLGVRAIETVLNALREKNNHLKEQIVLKTELRLRESCGCPSPQRD